LRTSCYYHCRAWVLAGVLTWSLSACGEKKEDLPKLTYSGPLIETENVSTLLSDSARLQIKYTAPLEQMFENGDQIWKKGIQIAFYAKDGTLVNTLAAKYGKMDKAKNLYIMRGDVRVDNRVKQQNMRTEELFYDKARGQIYTDTAMFVTVTTPLERLTGYGLTAKQDFSLYRIRRPTGVFSVNTADVK
jgi:LPS export ABC transporter protein LptC